MQICLGLPYECADPRMTTLQQRFAILAKRRPDVVQADLARVAGVKPPSVNDWFSGKTKSLKGNTAAKVAKHYGVSVQWLTTGEGPMEEAGETLLAAPTRSVVASRPALYAVAPAADGDFTIPEYDTGGKMGNGGLVLKDQPGMIRSWRVSSDWVAKNIHNVTSVRNLAIVTGFGDSMRPLYNPGDPLLIDTGVTTVDFDGIYFFRVDGEGFVKRLQRIPGQGLTVISENPSYRDWTLTPAQLGDQFEVFGRVVKVWRGTDF